MGTSKKSTGKPSKDPTSSAAATPVNLSVRLADGEVKKIRATCGHGLEKPLADYDPDTQSWKMYGDISLWEDCPLLANLPPSGMTRNGVLYLQPAWEPITAATGSSLWPTPTAHPDNTNTTGKFKNPTLGDAVRMWPTPRASASMTEDTQAIADRLNNGAPYKARLEEAVAMWPTPKSSDHKAAVIWPIEKTKSRDMALRETIAERDPSAIGGKLNPMWVEWLMGFPLGWTDLGD